MSEDRILQALQELAERDGELRAQPELEARLVQEFRKRQVTQRRILAWRWASGAAVAAGIAVAAFVITKRTSEGQAPIMIAAPAVSIAAPAPQLPVAAVRKETGRKHVVATQNRPQEMVTDFFPLMDPAPPFDRGQMLRVQLPAAAMRTVGLPVREDHLGDPIEADVLVGEEGLPRAIRFVRFNAQSFETQ